MLSDVEAKLVQTCHAGRLGTIARDGRPNLVPVCYAYTDGQFVIPVDQKPKRAGKLARIRNIERDPRVTLLIDHYDDDWSQLAWVRVEGTGHITERGAEAPDAIAALRSRYRQYETMNLEELPLITIEPERVVSWRWEEDAS